MKTLTLWCRNHGFDGVRVWILPGAHEPETLFVGELVNKSDEVALYALYGSHPSTARVGMLFHIPTRHDAWGVVGDDVTEQIALHHRRN